MAKEKKKIIKLPIKWEALEYPRYPKKKSWFAGGSIIAAVIIGYALFSKNFLMAIVFLLATLVIWIYALKEPKRVRFEISGKGIKVGERLYEYNELKSFWIFYNPPEIKELSVKTKKTFNTELIIPLAEENPVKIRRALLEFIPEEKQEESVLASIAKNLRF